MDIKKKLKNRVRRHKRVRAIIIGTSERPRLSIFRSNNHIYAQLIDDREGKTVLWVSDIEIKKKNAPKTEIAGQVGENLAKKALSKGMTTLVFDRGGYKYHGAVKALAEGARESGLKL